jgi:hypothetical protein
MLSTEHNSARPRTVYNTVRGRIMFNHESEATALLFNRTFDVPNSEFGVTPCYFAVDRIAKSVWRLNQMSWLRGDYGVQDPTGSSTWLRLQESLADLDENEMVPTWKSK